MDYIDFYQHNIDFTLNKAEESTFRCMAAQCLAKSSGMCYNNTI